MNELEKKINICLRWIVCDNERAREAIKKTAELALEELERAPRENDRDRIMHLFKELGVRPGNLGFEYLMYGIELALEDSEYLRKMTRMMYPTVAERFSTSPSAAERAMRFSVDLLFEQGCYEAIQSVFGGFVPAASGKVTTGQFLSICTLEINKRKRGKE